MKNQMHVLITDINIELYDTSVPLWAEYGITSHRVDDIEQALIELSKNSYELVVIVENKALRPEVLKSIAYVTAFTEAPLVIASTDMIDAEYRIQAHDIGAGEVWEMPTTIQEAVAKGNALIRMHLNSKKKSIAHANLKQTHDTSLRAGSGVYKRQGSSFSANGF